MFLFFREVVEMILEKGFDINVRTSRGTALHEAAICGKVRPLRTRRAHATYSLATFEHFPLSRWTW